MISIKKITEDSFLESIKLSPIKRMDLIKYSGASGDFNPIHTIDQAAKEAGLPSIIAHGMLTMGNITKIFLPYYQQGFIQEYSVRFANMVFIGDEVTVGGKLIKKADNLLTFKVHAFNQKDQEIIKDGLIKFKVYE